MDKQTLELEVNHPKHYTTHESGIEAITITRYLMGDLSNAWKYAMRYEDKGTPGKDLSKCCWYLRDWYNTFLDVNNVDTAQTTIDPINVVGKMRQVIDAEPEAHVKEIMRQILRITLDGGLVDPAGFRKAVDDLEKFAESFSK